MLLSQEKHLNRDRNRATFSNTRIAQAKEHKEIASRKAILGLAQMASLFYVPFLAARGGRFCLFTRGRRFLLLWFLRIPTRFRSVRLGARRLHRDQNAPVGRIQQVLGGHADADRPNRARPETWLSCKSDSSINRHAAFARSGESS